MSGSSDFKNKVENILKDGFSETEKEVVRTWYKIESKDSDISTYRLLSMVRNRTFLPNGKIIRIMTRFEEKFNKYNKTEQQGE